MSLLSPQLEAFMAVAKHKTVHGAAEAIHYTQTAVTQRLRTLEQRLNTTLFSRSRRGMMLTPQGEALLRYCHAAKELEGEALAIIQGAGIETVIQMRITGPTSFMSARVIPKSVNWVKEFPNLLLHFDITDFESREKSLRSGDCDLAIIQHENIASEMESKILQPEKYVLVCTPEWKNRKLRDIIKSERIIDYNVEDRTTYNYLKFYDLFDLASSERHFVNRADSMAAMICGGLGYGVLTMDFAKPYVERNELVVLNRNRTYENILAMVWYPRPEPPSYFTAVINSIL